jgi:LAO/AO transport system kinase
VTRAATIDVNAAAEGVLASDVTALARAITLVESTKPEHRDLAQELLTLLLPHAGGARRVGITGVPGVGKSTFIDALGSGLTSGRLADGPLRVAVLAVDPSSTRTRGSILGDKTRMVRLSTDPLAFIRPSPSSGALGGVTTTTRETMVVVEAAGFDVVLVETVGVGQSETSVAAMVDCFLVLMLARTGDSLQGIKKGVLELADVLAVNKADGSHEKEAALAARELADALHLMQPHDAIWAPPVLTCSGLNDRGLGEVWAAIERHRSVLDGVGELQARRQRQQIGWMWHLVDEQLRASLRNSPEVRAIAAEVEAKVAAGTLPVTAAAQKILAAATTPP